MGTELFIFTRMGVVHIRRFAFELARPWRGKQLTVVTKLNAHRNEMVMWDDTAAEVASRYRDVRQTRC